ncbi:MAG TPA: hypothetical protein VG104_08675 [Candidatus Dormibacteraeota bacterium]|jgi:hypothetical protein|nr:hypothetical protein [Candidatus Dormibacteraeota bacterium]
MSQLRSPLRIVGAIVIAAALVWGSGTIASALPQTERLHATVHSTRIVDYATDVAAPGSPFFRSRATYDQ